jgi:hypothetical protein
MIDVYFLTCGSNTFGMLKPVLLMNAYEIGDSFGKIMTGLLILTLIGMIIFVMFKYLGTKK